MKKRVVIFSVFLLILISSVSATFSVGNTSQLNTVYGPNENIRGWINMSFTNELVDSLFSDSPLDNSISLIKLLESDFHLSKGVDYSCTPTDCGTNYIASNGKESKTFDLGFGDEVLLGFRFVGDIEQIESIKFDINSDAGPSCTNQLELDFLKDGTIELGNNMSQPDSICGVLKREGCFKPQSDYYDVRIAHGPELKHCQRITLSKSPGFRLGAWLTPEADPGHIKMSVYNSDDTYFDDELINCEIEDIEPGIAGEYFCEVDLLITKEEDYFVCIYSNKDGEDSQIRGYTPSNGGCGFFYSGGGINEISAYNMFATGRKFALVGNLSIDESGENSDVIMTFESEIDRITGGDYICDPECVIPFRLISGTDQILIINNVEIRQRIAGIGSTTVRNVYDVVSSSATVSTSNFTKIYLDEANFSVPGSHGGIPYTLSFEGATVLTTDLTIQAVPEITALSPMTTASLFPTRFRIFVNEVENYSIDTYVWDFDGEEFTTSDNKITYTFQNTGNFPVEITVTDVAGKSSSKTFNVEVLPYINVLNKEINKSQTNLENIKKQIEDMPIFEQESLNQVINVELLNSKLKEVQQLYGQTQYEEAVGKLLELDIPESIVVGVSTSLVAFYPSKDNINLDIVKAFQGGIYNIDREEAYVDSIITWHTGNLETKVQYSQIEADYADGRIETLLTVIDFKAKQLTTQNYSIYIFLPTLDNLRFQSSYGNETKEGYNQIPFDVMDKTIKFSTTEAISFLDLPIFVSPSISNLVVVGEIDGEEEKGMKWAMFILLIILLLIVGFVVYIILQHWYKTRYETYLFKNRNYLYNLITYIQTSKKKGMKDSEIIRKLKKTGWNSEQITYVMKKYIGKRTGMWEVPIDKLLDLFRKKKVITPLLGMGPPKFTPGPRVAPALPKRLPVMRKPVVRRPISRTPVIRRPVPGTKGPVKPALPRKKGFPKK